MTLPTHPSPDYVPQVLGATAEALLAIRGHAEQVKGFLERSRVPMVLVDDERRYVEVNRPAQLMARLSRDELRRSRIDDLTPPEEIPIMEANWGRMVETGCVAGPREIPGVNRRTLEILYFGLAGVLPGLHVYAFVPADWTEDELGVLDAESAGPSLRPLTPREREVLQLAAEGFSTLAVAERLVVSPATVKTHFSNIYEKLGVTGRPAAVAKGMRLGFIA